MEREGKEKPINGTEKETLEHFIVECEEYRRQRQDLGK